MCSRGNTGPTIAESTSPHIYRAVTNVPSMEINLWEKVEYAVGSVINSVHKKIMTDDEKALHTDIRQLGWTLVVTYTVLAAVLGVLGVFVIAAVVAVLRP